MIAKMPESDPCSFAVDGIVFAGLGQGAKFLALEWVRRQLREKTGLEFFPGTLNLRIPQQLWSELYSRRNSFIKISDPAAPSCPGFLQRVTLGANGLVHPEAYLILPEATVYNDVLEIIAAENLRNSLALKDGDTVRVATSSSGTGGGG